MYLIEKDAELGLEPGDIKGIEDLENCPLRQSRIYGTIIPMIYLQYYERSRRVHASSGTTGRPTVVGYTRKDLTTWSEVVARCLYASGVKKTISFRLLMDTVYLQED